MALSFSSQVVENEFGTRSTHGVNATGNADDFIKLGTDGDVLVLVAKLLHTGVNIELEYRSYLFF